MDKPKKTSFNHAGQFRRSDVEPQEPDRVTTFSLAKFRAVYEHATAFFTSSIAVSSSMVE